MSDLYDDGLEALDECYTADCAMVCVITLDSEGTVRVSVVDDCELTEDEVAAVVASAARMMTEKSH
jgi:hypothetical protein